jgi:CRP-like cAMP-binding protein
MKKPKRATKIPFEINPMAPEIQAYFETMFGILSRFIPHFYPSLRSAILNSCEIFSLKKNDVLLDYGETCRYCYFAIKGAVKAEDLHNGIERIVWFMAEYDTMISLDSFYDQLPSIEKLIAIEDTICIAILKEKLEAIYDEHHAFERLGRKLTEYYHRQTMRRTKWMTLSAEERYTLFFQEHPKFINRIKNKDMASFLGISEVHLKRIKKAFWKK